MSKRLVCAFLTGALAVAATSGSAASARPPDLPIDTKDVCIPAGSEEASEPQASKPYLPNIEECVFVLELAGRIFESPLLGLGGFPFSLDVDLTAPEEGTLAGGALGGHLGGALAGAALGGMGNAAGVLVRPRTVRTVAPAAAPPGVDARRHEHARRMYLIGERCRQTGDWEMAQNCYEETRRLCPASPYAAKAVARLEQVQAARPAGGATEEAEPAREAAPPMAARPAREVFHETTEDLQRLTQTRVLFFMGERCRLNGDPDMAYRCYREAHELCPACAYGRKALQAMQALDARKDGEEASSTDLPEARKQRRGKAQPRRPGHSETHPATPRPWLRSWRQDQPASLGGGACAAVHTAHARVVAAERAFDKAERLLRAGDVAGAYVHYQETHLIDPDCPCGQKAIKRLHQIELDTPPGFAGEQEPDPPEAKRGADFPPAVWLSPQLLPLDHPVAHATEAAGSLEIVVEDTAKGSEEEEDYPLLPCRGLCPQTEPPSLFVAPAPRNLTIREESQDVLPCGGAGCADLSDWLRQTVRALGAGGSLRIEAARLRDLMARGEQAVRELGCAIVHENGTCYVVYPAAR